MSKRKHGYCPRVVLNSCCVPTPLTHVPLTICSCFHEESAGTSLGPCNFLDNLRFLPCVAPLALPMQIRATGPPISSYLQSLQPVKTLHSRHMGSTKRANHSSIFTDPTYRLAWDTSSPHLLRTLWCSSNLFCSAEVLADQRADVKT